MAKLSRNISVQSKPYVCVVYSSAHFISRFSFVCFFSTIEYLQFFYCWFFSNFNIMMSYVSPLVPALFNFALVLFVTGICVISSLSSILNYLKKLQVFKSF